MMNELQGIKTTILQMLASRILTSKHIIFSFEDYPDMEDFIDQLLSAETEDYRVTVVRKRAEVPAVKWIPSLDFTPNAVFVISNAFRRAYEKAGFVQEVKDEGRKQK